MYKRNNILIIMTYFLCTRYAINYKERSKFKFIFTIKVSNWSA